MDEPPVAARERLVYAGLAHRLAEREAHLVGAADQRDCGVGFGGHRGQAPWNVRLITSICCSRVRRTKFTAYPETRMVSCGSFPGWSIASSSISRLRTFTFM